MLWTGAVFGQPLVLGSKLGAEALVTGEMMAQLLEADGIPVQRKLGLGATEICFPALRNGQLDVYMEYTGTGLNLILHETLTTHDKLENFLTVQTRFRDNFGMVWLPPFGFDNTYVLAIPRKLSETYQITKISHLKKYPHLRAAFTFQFMQKPELYPAMSRKYELNFKSITEMEHALAYSALREGKVDLVEAYSTDGELLEYDLVALEDDQHFFPLYQAAPLMNPAVVKRHPQVANVLDGLAFQIDNRTMQDLNSQVLHGRPVAEVARQFLRTKLSKAAPVQAAGRSSMDIQPLLLQHLQLTAVTLALAVSFAVPAGIWLSRRPRTAGLAIGLAAMVQTVPSMAMLAFFIPVPGLGLGARSAILALFLYSLLPILRNTITGLNGIDPKLKEAAVGLGMTKQQLLWLVELPLALPTLMAGVRTATVITVGTATLAAFIGAGGLGVPIVTGLQLNDPSLILRGAVPAALLAVSVDFLLGLAQNRIFARR